MTASESKSNRGGPRYPMNLAFVVQMEDQAECGQTRLVGRVEHVSSGQSAEFDDPIVLMQFIAAFVHPALSPPAQPPEGEWHSPATATLTTARRGKVRDK